jgi:hypothetical protein
VPESPDTCGLQIPFDTMLEMTNILDEVELEDENGNSTGVYFDGISYVLYPTGYLVAQDTVQCHVRRKLKWQKREALAPDYGSQQKWTRHQDIKTLSSAKPVLGYCGEVETQLGTTSRRDHFQDYRNSMANREIPPSVIFLDASPPRPELVP